MDVNIIIKNKVLRDVGIRHPPRGLAELLFNYYKNNKNFSLFPILLEGKKLQQLIKYNTKRIIKINDNYFFNNTTSTKLFISFENIFNLEINKKEERITYPKELVSHITFDRDYYNSYIDGKIKLLNSKFKQLCDKKINIIEKYYINKIKELEDKLKFQDKSQNI